MWIALTQMMHLDMVRAWYRTADLGNFDAPGHPTIDFLPGNGRGWIRRDESDPRHAHGLAIKCDLPGERCSCTIGEKTTLPQPPMQESKSICSSNWTPGWG